MYPKVEYTYYTWYGTRIPVLYIARGGTLEIEK